MGQEDVRDSAIPIITASSRCGNASAGISVVTGVCTAYILSPLTSVINQILQEHICAYDSTGKECIIGNELDGQ